MTPILMPQIGQDIKHGTVVKWLKHPGDAVRRGEIVLTVESEKATFDIEAEVDGVLLQTLCNEGQEAKVFEPVGWIGAPGEEPSPHPAASGTPHATAARAESRAPSAPRTSRNASSPSARRTARELSTSLSHIVGSGPGGRILRRDVLASTGGGPAARPPDADEVISYDPIQRRIGERLSLSCRTIPHFYLSKEMYVEKALTWRAEFNRRRGCRVSVTDLVCRAAIVALRDHPLLNSHVADDGITKKAHINLGVAVATARGLFVPVLPDADTFDLVRLSEQLRRLAETARDGQYVPGVAGTFTVTSLGMFGITSFLPIINPPECAILAIGEAVARPVVVEGRIEARSAMMVSLACDHRAVDGVYAAGFLTRIASVLERPSDLAAEDAP